MTWSIELVGVLADFVILVALVTAVASPRVSHLGRPVIATFAFACAWLLTAAFDALRAPGWTLFMGGAVIAVSIVVITVTVHLWTRAGDGTESGTGQRGDHGGGGPRRRPPDAPQHGGGGSDPDWWPEFERQLAFYIAERERQKRQPAALPAEPAPYAATLPLRPHGIARTPPRQADEIGKESSAVVVHITTQAEQTTERRQDEDSTMRASRLRGFVTTCATSAVVLAITACGSSHTSSTAHPTTSPDAVASTPTTTASPAPARSPRLRIIAPRRGARVTPTLTIRVSLTGATATGPRALKYVLDGTLTRLGSPRLTFHGLAPGDHHLVVAVASQPSIKARVGFTVPAPAAPAPAAPTPALATTSSAPTPTPMPPPAPSSTQAPAPAPPPAPSGGIPQGANAGDADSDNHGGPSDGDGNL